MDIFSYCSWIVCLFSCLPGCLMSFIFGNTKNIMMPWCFPVLMLGGLLSFFLFFSFLGERTKQGGRGRSREENSINGVMEFSPWLSEQILDFISKTFYKIWQSLLDVLFVTASTMNYTYSFICIRYHYYIALSVTMIGNIK